MSPSLDHPLIHFLMADLAVPTESIAMGLRQIGPATNLLPMVLWQYGLVSTEELNLIFEWVETRGPLAVLSPLSGQDLPPACIPFSPPERIRQPQTIGG